MPLGVRDVLLVIRAKDQASRVIAEVGASLGLLEEHGISTAQGMKNLGTALLGVGTAVAILGAAGVAFFASATKSAIDYNKEVALTFTQVDKGKGTFEDIQRIGLETAKAIPAPFKEMQGALYDIFSSLDVNASESQKLLEAFAKSAVAGQVDIRTAGRATIALMNAYGLGVGDLSHLMDVQFQLVRKGVGTYEEFASTIGLAIPSARRAGQSVETLAGTLAFLTRNGLSASRSATSAGRAFDTLANTKVISRLHDMGIEVVDGTGKFRQINEVATELGKKLEGLTDADKAAKLEALFKGAGGTIQARRFWDVAIRNYDELNQRVQEMVHSAGAAQAAYKIMFDQPAAQAQLLKNRLETLRVELGENLIPVFNQVLHVGTDIVNWFDKLDAKTKQSIAQIGLIVSVILLVGGAVTALAGGFAILVGSLAGFVGGVGTALLIIASLTAALVALPFLIIGLVQHWDEFKDHIDGIKSALDKFKDRAQGIFNAVKDIIGNLIDTGRNVGKIFIEIANVIAPIAGLLLAVGFQAFINTIKILTAAVRDLTGFFADNKVALGALAGVIAALVLPGLIELLGLWVAIQALTVVEWIQGVIVALGEMSIAEAAATAGLSLIGAAVGAFLVWISGPTGAQKAAKDFAETMAGGPKTFSEYGSALVRVKGAIKDLKDENVGLNGQLYDGKHNFNEVTTAINNNKDKIAALMKVQSDLNAAYKVGNEVVKDAAPILGMTRDEVIKFAEANKISLLNLKETDRGGVVDSLITKFQSMAASVHLSTEAFAAAAGNDAQAMQVISDTVTKATDETKKNFLAAADIVSQLGSQVGTTAQQIQDFYTNAVQGSKDFVKNINKAIQDGYDPELIARILQAGPEKAGPLLQAMVTNNSAKLVQMVNDSEQAIRDLSDQTVELTRLTTLATTSMTDDMSRNLKIAMGADVIIMNGGGQAQLEAYAKGVQGGMPAVQHALDIFNITVAGALPPDPTVTVNVETLGARQNIAELAKQLDALLNLMGLVTGNLGLIGSNLATTAMQASAVAATISSGIVFGFAAGGDPKAGTVGVVGELGPELVYFKTGGGAHVLSNAQSRDAIRAMTNGAMTEGIQHFATGGYGAPGTFGIVGEAGRELIQFGSKGGYVYNNTQTNQLLTPPSHHTFHFEEGAIPITIQDARDPDAVGKKVVSSLGELLKDLRMK